MTKDESQAGINTNEFASAISQICDEKGIDKEKVIETIEAALAAAYKKDYGKKSQNIRAKFDEVSGATKFFLVKEVVDETTREFVDLEHEDEIDEEVVEQKKDESVEDEDEKLPRFNLERDITLEEAKKDNKDVKLGDEIETELEAKSDYGRIAAQTAKQVIIQRIREAERAAMFKEYKEKEGEVVNGTIQRIEGRNVFVDIGKSVGILFPSEQVRGENYGIGQRIKVYISSVEVDNKGAGIILSRASAELVKKLFELEVPEIFSGVVEIKAIAREAGSRTKIAVQSKEEGIDPVGSCVGQKGTRVQTIIDEIGGEKIDIIEWSDDIEKFITAAISPAKVVSVEIKDVENKEAEIVVPADQLSLAIGKSGQNVRLAAKLTGWKIDVIGEGEGSEAETPQTSDEGGEEVEEKAEEVKKEDVSQDETQKEEVSEEDEK